MDTKALLKECRRAHNLVNRVDISKGKNMLASRGEQFQVPLIEIRKSQKLGWFFTQRLTAHPQDPMCMQALYAIGTYCGMNGLSYEEFQGTKNIVNINLTARVDKEQLEEFLRRNNKVLIGDGFMTLSVPKGKQWVDEHPLFLNGSVLNVPNTEKHEAEEYTLISAVPSQMRRWTATYCRSDLVPKFEECFEKLTAGTASNLLNHEVEVKEIVKCVAKYFLLMVPGIRKDFPLDKYGCTIYLGKFGGDEERCDGAAKVSDAVVADKLNIGRDEARSLFCQMRNFKTSKVAAIVEPLEQLSRFEGITIKQLKCDIIYVDKFEDIWDKDEDGRCVSIKKNFNGNLIHVGNPHRCDFLSDLNGFKHVPKITDAEESFMILDMGKDSGAHSNMQFLQYNQDYPGFENTIVRLGIRDVKHRIRTMIRKRSYISGLDINLDNIYAPNLISQITPKVFSQPFLKNAIEKAIVTSLNKVIHRMHFSIDGSYLRGTAGPEFWLDSSHYLQEHEVFINNDRYWGKHCVVLRNPRSASCERYSADVVSLWTIIDRILNDDTATESEKIYYCRWYANISRNVLVCTGSNEFKDENGGADFDFDGYAVVFEKDIVDMLESTPAYSVKIPKDKSSAGTKFCHTLQEVVTEGFIRTLTTGNKGVADVAIENSKVQSLRFYEPTEEEPSIQEVYSELRKNMNAGYDGVSNVKYTPLFSGPCEIGENEVMQSKTMLRMAPDNVENMRAYLDDVSTQFIAIIGRIIDSAKTGESVTDPFVWEDEEGDERDGLSCIHQMFREIDRNGTKRPFACIVWNEKKLCFEPEIREHSFRVVKKDETGTIIRTDYFIADKVYRAQCRIVRWAVRLINGLRRLASVTPEEEDMHKKYASLPCTKSLKELDLASSDMAKISTVSNIDSKAVGQGAIKVAQPYISDMARMYMDIAGVPKEERFLVATAVKDIDTVSSFAYNQLKPEAIQYALTLDGAIHTLRERILPLRTKKFYRMRQEFVDGRSEDFVCTSFKFNGTYTVVHTKNGWFFELDIRKFIELPDPSGKLLFRGVALNEERIQALNQKIVNKNDYTWKVETYFPLKNAQHPDALYTIDKDGNKEFVCRIKLANDAFTGVMNNWKISVDDVVNESFAKQKNGSTKTIHSVSFLCEALMDTVDD